MKLELGPADLLPEHRNLYPSQVTWHHLTGEAQLAVNMVGQAIYRPAQGNGCIMVFPPHLLQTIAERASRKRGAKVVVVLAVTVPGGAPKPPKGSLN